MGDTENQADPQVLNLFGEWVYVTPRKRGRPRFEWTQENSNKVMMLLAMGWSNDRIAGAIVDPRTGETISVKTLQRYFSRELKVRDHARDRLVAQQLMKAHDAASTGNVGAMRFFETLKDKNDLALAQARLTEKPEGKSAKSVPLGKKAAQQRDAQSLVQDGGDAAWGDDLKPGYH